MLNRRALLWFWLPSLIWAGLIFSASFRGFSSEHTESILFPIFKRLFPHHSPVTWAWTHLLLRKLAHWAEYFVLAVLLYRGFRRDDPKLWNRRWALGSLALVAALALGDELHQAHVPNRSGCLQDSLLDIFGGACGIAAEYGIFRRRRARREATPEDPAFRYPD